MLFLYLSYRTHRKFIFRKSFWCSRAYENSAFDGLNWENTRSRKRFLFFSPSRTEKMNWFSRTFFGSLRRFLHSLHFTPVVTGRYVFRSWVLRLPLRHPKGDPASAPDSAPIRSRLHDPSLLPFVSFVPKSLSGSKKVLENQHFFGSLGRKKKFARTYSNLRVS